MSESLNEKYDDDDDDDNFRMDTILISMKNKKSDDCTMLSMPHVFSYIGTLNFSYQINASRTVYKRKNAFLTLYQSRDV